MAYYYQVEIESAGVLTPDEIAGLKVYITAFESDWGFSKATVASYYEDEDGDPHPVLR